MKILFCDKADSVLKVKDIDDEMSDLDMFLGGKGPDTLYEMRPVKIQQNDGYILINQEGHHDSGPYLVLKGILEKGGSISEASSIPDEVIDYVEKNRVLGNQIQVQIPSTTTSDEVAEDALQKTRDYLDKASREVYSYLCNLLVGRALHIRHSNVIVPIDSIHINGIDVNDWRISISIPGSGQVEEMSMVRFSRLLKEREFSFDRVFSTQASSVHEEPSVAEK